MHYYLETTNNIHSKIKMVLEKMKNIQIVLFLLTITYLNNN